MQDVRDTLAIYVDMLEDNKLKAYKQEWILANSAFMANCANNPHISNRGCKNNMYGFRRYMRRLERKINKGQFELTIWEKRKMQKNKNKKI